MATLVAQQPTRSVLPGYREHRYVACGPTRRNSLGHLKCGHQESPQWIGLPKSDKKQWDWSSHQSQHIFGDRHPSKDWVPPSQRPKFIPQPAPEVPEARALKQSHLHGNVGIITNPQPSTTDTTNFLIRVPYHKVNDVDKSSRPLFHKDRKIFEYSSEILNSPRLLNASTQSPRQELFDASYPNFPYGDTCLDEHVPKSLNVRAIDAPPQPQTPSSPRRSPRAKFEPPTRPGACFRRRSEKNFSDILGSSPPVAYGLNRLPRADMNTLGFQGFDYQDTRTEVARRNGEFRVPARMRSAPELPGTDAVRSPRSLRRQSYRESPPAGIGGCGGGGESELMMGLDEEEAMTERADVASGKIWDAMKRHSIDIEAMPSPLTRARRQLIMERSKVFGEAKPIDWGAVHSPREYMPGMDVPIPQRMRKSPLGEPRSPRCKSRDGLLRGGGNPRDCAFSPRVAYALQSEEEIFELPCKAASRGHYQRAMSSDPADLFGTDMSLA